MKERREKLLDLLSGKTFDSLEEEELKELESLEKEFPEFTKLAKSFELTAAAISLTDLDMSEPLPSRLKEKILQDAENYFRFHESEKYHAIETEEKPSFFAWLGWAVAGVACIALAVNVYLTHFQGREDRNSVQAQQGRLNLIEEREKILSMPDLIKLDWLDPQNPNQVIGDLAWSNSVQKGFVRFYALPVNDPNKEIYQLWIVDENQKYPIDAGLFSVSNQGEVILPIDVRLRVEKPKMFVVTAEKPGGVVVSELKKIVAIAKTET